jgi:hypothetical protein
MRSKKRLRCTTWSSRKNDIVAVVEQVENTDLVVTMVEPLPVVVGVDVTNTSAPIKAEKVETVENRNRKQNLNSYSLILTT